MDVSTPAPAAAPNTTTTLTSTLTTTTTPHGTCVFWGDPHVITFDESNPSFYGEGEFWIIKSDTVHIQGRFLGTQYTDGLAATNKIVVGGPFLKGHKIEVGPLQGGHAIVDGERVLPTLHSNYSIEDLFELTYDAQGTLIDEKQASFGKHIVHMDLPLGVRVTVDRWINYIDLKIEMQSQAGLDGACGNFNRDSSDDTTQAIIERVGASVPKDELMFHSHAAVNFTVEMKDMLQDDCPKDRLLHARSECESQLSQPSSEEMDSCMFNVCFGGNDHALRVAQTFDPQPNRTKNASAQATGALRDGDNAAELASSTAAPTMAASTTTATAQARAAPLEGSKATDLASPTAAPPTTASTTTATAQARAALREGSKVTELARPTAAPTTTASTTTASAQATAAMHERGKATELAWPTVAPTTAV